MPAALPYTRHLFLTNKVLLEKATLSISMRVLFMCCRKKYQQNALYIYVKQTAHQGHIS